MIEEVLGGEPGKLAFRALCAAVGGSAELLARCGEALASWPDEVREAPWSWLAALDAGYTKPTWSLVRSLTMVDRHLSLEKLPLPDPRVRPEVRGVTRIDLGWFATERLAELVDTLDHWPELREVRTGWLLDVNTDVVARLAEHPGLARLESLDLVTLAENLWDYEKPPFRPAGGPLRLRHAGLRAPDLVHLLRTGLVPELRSADVLVCSAEEARELADCPGLGRLDRLAIGFRCGKNGRQPLWQPFFGNVIEADDDAAEVFFAHADLTGLRTLEVRGTSMGTGREGLGARGVEAIVGSGVLGRLTSLTLELVPVGDDTLVRVVEAVDPDRLEELRLVDLVATDRTVEAFGGAFPKLRHLDLSRNRIGEAGARRLASQVRLPALAHLDLSGTGGGSPYYSRSDFQVIGDGGATAWAASDNAVGLKSLRLVATALGADGLGALLRSKRLRDLGALDVSHNPMGSWPADVPLRVRTLLLADCGLGDDDVEALTAVASAPRLRSVSLAYNTVGTRGARALARWAVLPQLWELDLHDHVIGDDGLVDLARSGAARRLLELDLEQDCWNAGRRKYSVPLPAEVVDPASFPALDALYLGVVDEYHGARYSAGFPSAVREELVAADGTRPELVAFLSHLSTESLSDEDVDVRADRDFRSDRAERYAKSVEEALEFARRMHEGEIGWPPPE
ncbi:leucine-rich repeat domain-containing protein [Saccharothrix variisporea]|uniref:Leucine rich repeat (LRR) protein n=1 Tax=Saccharothrix variisporea TaxID=543527 RepID=A0A495XG38_9PSEU|nr:hypothetical protein [Saccharothrix variisporea]RKT72992.1 leucine rich repeat (LRR) protein [Saccharothrix variisporea]